MKTTVGQLRAMLHGLPDDLSIEFHPISDAWLGTSGPMRAKEVEFYSADGNRFVQPDEDGAKAVVYIYEDRATDDQPKSRFANLVSVLDESSGGAS